MFDKGKFSIDSVAIDLDVRRDLLLYIKETNPEFYDRLYNGYLKDKLTFSDLEKALFEALASVGITILIDKDLTIWLEYQSNKIANAMSGISMLDKHDDFDSALTFAIALLKVKK